MPNRNRRKFSDEFKADAVRLVRVGDKSIGQVAKDLDLTESSSVCVARTSGFRWSAQSQKSGGLLREGERVKFAFSDVEKALYPVSVLCSVLAVSRSGFYAWQDRAPSKHAKEDARLAVEVAATHTRSRNLYGSPRVHADLKARGVRVGKNRIAGLMREQGLRARQKRRFRKTTDSAHAFPVAPNLLARDFQTSAPNDVWVGDVTFIWTREAWLHLALLGTTRSRRASSRRCARSCSTPSTSRRATQRTLASASTSRGVIVRPSTEPGEDQPELIQRASPGHFGRSRAAHPRRASTALSGRRRGR